MLTKELREELAKQRTPLADAVTTQQIDQTSPSADPLTTLSIDWPQVIGALLAVVLPHSDDVLSNPAKLGTLLTVCAQLAQLEPVVRERATTLALQRSGEIPGWTLVRRDGSRYVEAQRIVELCLHCPLSNLQKLVTALAMQQGNVSERKYQELCESAGLATDSEAVRQTGAIVFLRRNSKS
jgi:hypothetical protein